MIRLKFSEIESINGKRYYNGKLFEVIIYDSVGDMYFKNGVLHREDGPTIYIESNGNKFWYYNGEMIDCYSQEEFEKIIKLLIFK